MASKPKPFVMNTRLRDILSEKAAKMSAQQRKVALSFIVVNLKEFNDNLQPLGDDRCAPDMGILFNLKLLIVERHQPLGNLAYFQSVSKEKVADVIRAYIDDIFSCNLEVINTVSPSDKETLQILNCLKMCRVNHSLKYNVGPFYNIIHIFDSSYLIRNLLKLFQRGTIYFAQQDGTEAEVSYFNTLNDVGDDLSEVLDNINTYKVSLTTQAVSIFSEIAKTILKTNGKHNFTSKFSEIVVRLFRSLNTEQDTNSIPYDSLWDAAIKLFKTIRYERNPEMSVAQYANLENCMLRIMRIRTIKQNLGPEITKIIEECDETVQDILLEKIFKQSAVLQSFNVEEEAKKTTHKFSSDIGICYKNEHQFFTDLMNEFYKVDSISASKHVLIADTIEELKGYISNFLAIENGAEIEESPQKVLQKKTRRKKLLKVPDKIINTPNCQSESTSTDESKEDVVIKSNSQIVAQTMLAQFQTQSLKTTENKNETLILRAESPIDCAEQNKSNEQFQLKHLNVFQGESVVHNNSTVEVCVESNETELLSNNPASYFKIHEDRSNYKQIEFVDVATTTNVRHQPLYALQNPLNLEDVQDQTETFNKTELKDCHQSQFYKTEHSFHTESHSEETNNEIIKKQTRQIHEKQTKVQQFSQKHEKIALHDKKVDLCTKKQSKERPKSTEITKNNSELSNKINKIKKTSFFQSSMLEYYTIYTVVDGIRTLLVPEKRVHQSEDKTSSEEEQSAKEIYAKPTSCDKNNDTQKTNFKFGKNLSSGDDVTSPLNKVGDGKPTTNSITKESKFTSQDLDLDENLDCNKNSVTNASKVEAEDVLIPNKYLRKSEIKSDVEARFIIPKKRTKCEQTKVKLTRRKMANGDLWQNKTTNEIIHCNGTGVNIINENNKEEIEVRTRKESDINKLKINKPAGQMKSEVEAECKGKHQETSNHLTEEKKQVDDKGKFKDKDFEENLVKEIGNLQISKQIGNKSKYQIDSGGGGRNNKKEIEVKTQKESDIKINKPSGQMKSEVEAECKDKHQETSNQLAEEKKQIDNKGKSKDKDFEENLVKEIEKLYISKQIGSKSNYQIVSSGGGKQHNQNNAKPTEILQKSNSKNMPIKVIFRKKSKDISKCASEISNDNLVVIKKDTKECVTGSLNAKQYHEITQIRKKIKTSKNAVVDKSYKKYNPNHGNIDEISKETRDDKGIQENQQYKSRNTRNNSVDDGRQQAKDDVINNIPLDDNFAETKDKQLQELIKTSESFNQTKEKLLKYKDVTDEFDAVINANDEEEMDPLIICNRQTFNSRTKILTTRAAKLQQNVARDEHKSEDTQKYDEAVPIEEAKNTEEPKDNTNKEINKNGVLNNEKLDVNEPEQLNKSEELNRTTNQRKEKKDKSSDTKNKLKYNQKQPGSIKVLKKQTKNENIRKHIEMNNFNVNIFQATVVDEQNNLTKLENSKEFVSVKVESCQGDKHNKTSGEKQNQDTNTNKPNTNSDTQHDTEETQSENDLNNNNDEETACSLICSLNLPFGKRKIFKRNRKQAIRGTSEDNINKQLHKLAQNAQQKANDWDVEDRFGSDQEQIQGECREKKQEGKDKPSIFIFEAGNQTFEKNNSVTIQNAAKDLIPALPKLTSFLELLKNSPNNLANIKQQSEVTNLNQLELSQLKPESTKLNQTVAANVKQQDTIIVKQVEEIKLNQSDATVEVNKPIELIKENQQGPVNLIQQLEPTNPTQRTNLNKPEPPNLKLPKLSESTKLNQRVAANVKQQDPIVEEIKLNQPEETLKANKQIELIKESQTVPLDLIQPLETTNQTERTYLSKPESPVLKLPEDHCIRCYTDCSLAELYDMSTRGEQLDACDECLSCFFDCEPTNMKVDVIKPVEVFKPQNIPNMYTEPMEIVYSDDIKEEMTETESNQPANSDRQTILPKTKIKLKKKSKKKKKKVEKQKQRNEEVVSYGKDIGKNIAKKNISKVENQEQQNKGRKENDKHLSLENADKKLESVIQQNVASTEKNESTNKIDEETSTYEYAENTSDDLYSKESILRAFDILRLKQVAMEMLPSTRKFIMVLQNLVTHMKKVTACENLQLANRVTDLANSFIKKLDADDEEVMLNVMNASLDSLLRLIQSCLSDIPNREKLEGIIHLLYGLQNTKKEEPVDLTRIDCFQAWGYTVGGTKEIFHNVHSMENIDDLLCTRMLSCNNLYDLIYIVASTDKQRVVDEFDDCCHLIDAQLDYSFKDDYNITLRPETK